MQGEFFKLYQMQYSNGNERELQTKVIKQNQ
jgi:hypothetical protein